jgi:phospholipase C
LVFDIYDALRNSPNWKNTLFVVTYDEHGGFYDHVMPPPVADGSEYETLGVHVPTLVVGPRVKRFVCHEAFAEQSAGDMAPEAWDHTALIRTILRVCLGSKADDAIKEMGGRVQSRSAHLGLMLEEEPVTERPFDTTEAELRLRSWREQARAARMPSGDGKPALAPDGAGQPFVLNEFQEAFAGYAAAMRDAGLPRSHN